MATDYLERMRIEHAKHKAREEKERAQQKRVLEKAIKLIDIPEGYAGELRMGDYCWEYRVFNSTEEIIFCGGGVGTTNFDTKLGRRTFDRRGVDASFYWLPHDYERKRGKRATKESLNAVIPEQLRRIAESRARFETAVPIPEIGHTIQPAELEKLRAELNRGGTRSFHPAGFGTGYVLTTAAKRARWAKPASAALTAFLNVKRAVYVETFDAD
jgi:hypothetical protein